MNLLPRILFSVVALSFAACSSFERGWRQAASAPVPQGDAFSGRWQGRWTSARHPNSGGELRCILKQTSPEQPSAPGLSRYEARFKAQWLAFSATYEVPLHGRIRGKTLFFSGTHKLPAIYGGIYRFEGTATRQNFSSTYDSSYDQGRFEMKRVP